MTGKNCCIFGAGEHFGTPAELPPDSFIIAADGGYDYLRGIGITPDLVIGDFDSLGAPPDGKNVLILPQVKDDTDMAAAIREATGRSFSQLHIYGGTGGRLDHTLANIQCLADLAGKGAVGYLYDRDAVITAISGGDAISFPEDSSGYVSAFAHTDSVLGVYERGLKYGLTDATLVSRIPLGVSNEFTGAAAEISIRSGILIVIYPRGVTPVIGKASCP